MGVSLSRPNNEWFTTQLQLGRTVDRAGAAEFTRFLKEKGVSIFADSVDWLVMPADLREEIMSWDVVLDVNCTRSFPHHWEFKGGKGIEWKEVKAEWTGPPEEFYKLHKKN